MKAIIAGVVAALAAILLFLSPPALAQAPPQPRTQCVASALAGGTGDKITIPLLPCNVTTTLLLLKLSATSTSTAPTIQQVGSPAQVVLHADGSALTAGELVAGTTTMLTNNGTNWVKMTQGFPVPNAGLANMNAYTIKCNATGSLALPADCQGLVLSPSPGTLASAISTTQSPHGAGSWIAVNTISIGPDDAAISGAANSLQGLRLAHSYGGSAMQGGRNTLTIQSVFTSASNAANANTNYVAFFPYVRATTGDNGTNLGAGARGSFFGINPFAEACGTAVSLECPSGAATNLFGLYGGEIDVVARAGSSMFYKAGLTLVSLGLDKVQGTSYDGALAISAATGSVGWKNGILIGDMNSLAQAPLSSDGAILSLAHTFGIQDGIDFGTWTFSRYIFHSAKFTVGGDGQTGLNVGALNGGLTVTSSGQPRLALNQSGGISTGFYSDANAIIMFDFTNGAERARLDVSGLTVAAGMKVVGLPASAGAGGLYVCVDSAGVEYKKAACP